MSPRRKRNAGSGPVSVKQLQAPGSLPRLRRAGNLLLEAGTQQNCLMIWSACGGAAARRAYDRRSPSMSELWARVRSEARTFSFLLRVLARSAGGERFDR